MTDLRPADAASTFAERLLPRSLWPYARLARLDRPIGWQLLLLPCLFGEALTALAAGISPSLMRIGLYLIGAIVMRAAGSTWNDLMDRDIDSKVERTRNRPLAAGSVTPGAAIAFILGLGLVGLVVLLRFSWFAFGVGASSLILIALYPLAKRVTSHPQIVLGLVFGWGALMSWADQFGALDLPVLLLYAAMIAWIIGYDTIYAMQDIEDDALIGIGSTARAYGASAHWLVIGCYATTTLLMLASAWTGGTGLRLVPGIALLGVALAIQVRVLLRAGVPAPPAIALRLFKSNGLTGFAASALMLLGALSA
jgi:4-hydroxybenzoate polyprenyltransferase